MSNTEDYFSFGNEMMNLINRLNIAAAPNKKQAGEVLVYLLETAEDFRKNQQWRQATACCEHGLNMTEENWKSGVDLSKHYSRGLVFSWLATIYLSSGKMNIAIDYYEEAARHFRSDTTSRTREEGIIWMILSKIYVLKKEWGKALGSSQHSLNAIDEMMTIRKDDKTHELVELIRSGVDYVKNCLHSYMDNLEDTSLSYGDRDVNYLPIYFDGVEQDNVTGELAFDREYDFGAEYVFKVSQKTAINPEIKINDLVLVRKLVSGQKKELVLGLLDSMTENTIPKFMYLIPRENHFYLASPPSDKNKDAEIIVVLSSSVTREEVEPLYNTLSPKPTYIDRRKIKLLHKPVGIVRALQ